VDAAIQVEPIAVPSPVRPELVVPRSQIIDSPIIPGGLLGRCLGNASTSNDAE